MKNKIRLLFLAATLYTSAFTYCSSYAQEEAPQLTAAQKKATRFIRSFSDDSLNSDKLDKEITDFAKKNSVTPISISTCIRYEKNTSSTLIVTIIFEKL